MKRLLLAPLVVVPIAVVACCPYLWPILAQAGAYLAPRPADGTEADPVG